MDFSSKFADAFGEVVMPVLSDMHEDVKILKSDVGILKQDVNYLKEQVSDIDDKLGSVDKRVINITDYQAQRLEDHGKRLEKLERKRVDVS